MMPVGRRASASAGNVVSPNPSAPGASRNHRNNDSQSIHSQAASSGLYHSYSGTSGTPQQKMVSVLVTRLKNKLPCYSGLHLSTIEADDAMQQAIETLVELSRETLDVIAWALTELLDKLAKGPTDETGQFTLHTMQSQLLVLKVLSVAMASRWRQNPESRPGTRNGDHASGYSTPLDSPSHTMSRTARFRPSRELLSSPPPPGSELTPLDENCARYVLSVMVLFLRQTAHSQGGDEDPSVFLLQDYESEEQLRSPSFAFGPQEGMSQGGALPPIVKPAIRTQPSATSFSSGASRVPIPVDTLVYTPTAQALADSVTALNNLIARTVGSIVYHLSASNWPIVFSRVRNRIRALEHEKAGSSPDITDLQLMALSALDRSRLVQLLQEVSSLLLNMKKETQVAIARPLAAAVWHWIDLYPEEFVDTLSSSRRMEGAPERAFDLIYVQHEATEHKVILSPVLTILMCVSHERLNHDFNLLGGARQSNKKEVFLVESFFKHMHSASSFAPTAFRCLIDICKAAARARPNQDLPLRSLASDVAHEIRRFLLAGPTQQPFWSVGEEIDVPLYADALVACFRFLSEEDSTLLFMACLEAERSEAVKLCAITACRMMLSDSKKFLWHKPLVNLGQAVSTRVRVLFKHTASRKYESDSETIKRPAVRPRSKGSANRRLSDRDLLLIGIVALWRMEPPIYYYGLQESTQQTNAEWLPISASPWDGPSESTVKISISRSFLFLLDKVFYMRPDDHFLHTASYWLPKMTPHYLFSTSNYLFAARLDLEAQEIWVGIVGDLLKVYIRPSLHEHIIAIKTAPERLPAFHFAEIVLLVSLTSVSNKVAVAAAQCLRVLASAERQASTEHKAATQAEYSEGGISRSLYDQLGDPQIMLLGRVGLQKRIRKVVSRLAAVHPSHLAVWQECFFRWTEVSHQYWLFNTPPHDDGRDIMLPKSITNEDLHHQWRNLTLFLAAFGAPCAPDQPYSHDALASYLPNGNLPDSAKTLMDPTHMVDTFLENIIGLLVSTNVAARDVAREALGIELTPRLYAKLYKHLDLVVNDVTKLPHSPWNEDCALFLDQFISVLKSIFDNLGNSMGEEMLSVDFGSTLLALAAFIARYNDEPAAVRGRIKFCALVESANKRAEKMSLVRRDNYSANEILDVISEWIQDPVALQLLGDEAIRLQQEVNMACLRAMVSAFERGPLIPIDMTGEDGNMYPAATRVFLRYSTLLARVLDYGRTEAPEDRASLDSHEPHRLQVPLKDTSELRELVSTGLVHLVSGNAESGLRHGLQMAYDADPGKRALFARVFARALTKGAKFEAAELPSANNSGSRLGELVKGSNMMVALAICDTCPPGEIDIIIPVLFNLFDTRRSLIDLLKAVINREIASTDTDTDLFRANTICTRMLSYFGRTHGLDYLRSLIIPLVTLMSDMPPERGYELDPNKVGEEQAAENLQNVMMIASSFLDIISASVHTLPSMFREICAYIARAVFEVWPGAKYAALGSFIFLRFISPAVVTPSTIDIEVPTNDGSVMRRGLMVIGKIVQSLANNMFFGKEAHMAVLNPYLKANIATVTRFLSEVNKFSLATAEEDLDEWLGTTQDETDTIVLRRFFEKHADKIGKELLSTSNATPQESTNAGKGVWDDLCSALVELGPPNELPKLSPMNSFEHHDYLDLMERYMHRNTDPVREMWTEAHVPLDQPAVFVMFMRKVDIEALDIDLVLYHILKTLTSNAYATRNFKIIFDFTSYTSASEIPAQWLRYCLEMFPADVRERFEACYLLNLNQLAHKYLRKIHNTSSGIASGNYVRAYSSVADLRQETSADATKPLVYASGLEEEECAEFKDVRIRQTVQLRAPVDLKIGTSHIRITSAKAQPLTTAISSKTTDIIPLAEISDVYHVSSGADAEFIIRRRHGATMFFSSPEREEIVKIVRDARGKVRGVHAPGTQRAGRHSNVYATLLHIGLSNICHEDHELRASALELLKAVCSDMNIDDAISASSGFVVPVYTEAFVVELSERLATSAPQLTLDFITEAVTGLDKMDSSTKIHNGRFVSPWIKNMANFTEPAHVLYDQSGARVRECIRVLVDVTTGDQEHYLILHKFVWKKVGKLEGPIITAVLEELMRAGLDAGVGSRRCQRVCETVAVLSSLTMRGRIFSRLRKVLAKTSLKPSRTLADNLHWNEISALTSLALAAGSHAKDITHIQLYIPELAHLVTMVGATGETTVRETAYFLVVTTLESLYALGATDDTRPEISELLQDCCTPKTLQAFGLARPNAASGYVDWDPSTEKAAMDMQENLAKVLIRVLEVASGSCGLLNVWRARWMSLVTSSAFQLSPCVQARAFVVMGILATAEVDDDLLYQMLVAIKTALTQCDESETTAVVSMLRCLCRVIPALTENSRYLPQLFWLAVALLQSGLVPFYIEAAQLLQVTLHIMEEQGAFKATGVSEALLIAREPLEEQCEQLDGLLGTSFEISFSFSLVAAIFKGVRVSRVRPSAESVLRSLLRTTVRSKDGMGQEVNAPICPEALGYFLALLPFSTTHESYRKLLEDAQADQFWIPSETTSRAESNATPRVPFDILGVNDAMTAMLVTSLTGMMLATAQGDDAESEILYALLADTAAAFPETVSLAYESLQDRIKDTFANSVNPMIINSASTIFRVSALDPGRTPALRSSSSNLGNSSTLVNSALGNTSTLGTIEESVATGPGKRQLSELEELGMQGLASRKVFSFLTPGEVRVNPILQEWIPNLVGSIIL